MDRRGEFEQYRAVAEVASEAFVTIDERSVIQSANPAVEAIFGYEPEAVVGEPLTMLMPEEFRDRHEASLQRYIDTGEPHLDWEYIELPGLHADGHEVPLAISFTEYEHAGQRYFTGIIRDNTDRKRLEAELTDTIQELEEVNEQLEASNQRLERFAHLVSHDLQEPLRMVTSYLHLLEDRYGTDLDDDAEEYIDYAVDGAERMRDMIDGLLEFARIETQDDTFEPVALDDVLDNALEDLQMQIEESGAEITRETLPTVLGDGSQLREVFQNLLTNAIKYSGDERPRIRVAAERTDEEWHISVQDEGIGIDPAYVDEAFDVFRRLHDEETFEGTGIGLALCKEIVERHGGDIWIESEAGEGATVHFTLPKPPEGVE